MAEWLIGTHAVMEALRSGRRRVHEVLVRGGEGGAAAAVLAAAERRGLRVRVVDGAEWRRCLGRDAGRVAAACEGYPYGAWESVMQLLAAREDSWAVVADGIEDPQNLGAIVRTAEAAGAGALFLPGRRAAAVTPAVVRASAGATEWLPICRVTNVVRTIEALARAGFWSVALAQDGPERWCRVDLRGRVALVVGGEGRGLRRLVRQRCDHVVTLPMRGRVESLNASAAFAAVAYELVRQRTS